MLRGYFAVDFHGRMSARASGGFSTIGMLCFAAVSLIFSTTASIFRQHALAFLMPRHARAQHGEKRMLEIGMDDVPQPAWEIAPTMVGRYCRGYG